MHIYDDIGDELVLLKVEILTDFNNTNIDDDKFINNNIQSNILDHFKESYKIISLLSFSNFERIRGYNRKILKKDSLDETDVENIKKTIDKLKKHRKDIALIISNLNKTFTDNLYFLLSHSEILKNINYYLDNIAMLTASYLEIIDFSIKKLNNKITM